jgi:hypothetical protein
MKIQVVRWEKRRRDCLAVSKTQRRVQIIKEEEAREKPHEHGYSCGVADPVNEDDEKLNTSNLEKED